MITAARQDILRFLRDAVASAGKLATRRDAAAAPQTFVFGNTSADLDSIISSIVYSYFATTPSKQYIPIVNLPDVPSGAELRRLRPELMEALKLSLASDSNGIPGNSDENAEGKLLKESLLTTHDLRQLLQEGVKQEKKRLNVMLVDWNALPKLSQGNGIPGISDALGDAVELSIVGCIDHHVDEHFVPPLSELPGQDPRRIQTPVGSCTSLVVSEIRYKGLWPDASESPTHHEDRSFMTYEAQAAKLAMSSILIDTINMTEEHKLSEADIEEVVFLEDKIRQGAYVNESIHWNRDAFYDSIARAKESSVNLLTLQEVFGRDYKEWLEDVHGKPQSNVKIGIINVGKPLVWVLDKAKSSNVVLLDEINAFANDRKLDAVGVMTTFTDEAGQFNRELAVILTEQTFVDEAGAFENDGRDILGLGEWEKKTNGEVAVPEDLTVDSLFHSENVKPTFSKVWQQHDLSKSRKQVAPLLRHAFAGIAY